MPLRKERQEPVAVNDRVIDRLIERGGSPSNGHASEEEQTQNVQLRIIPSLLSQIDAIRNRERKEIRKSRHAWIMEAILEKLKAEE